MVNYWKITGKRLETEQNGLIDFDISGAYFYLGALKPPGFRKIRDFQPENDLSPGILLDYCRRLSANSVKTRRPGTHGGFLRGLRVSVRCVVSK